MNESRSYTLRFSPEEVVAALKKAYPTNLSVRAMPAAPRMEADGKQGGRLMVTWTNPVRSTTEVLEGPT